MKFRNTVKLELIFKRTPNFCDYVHKQVDQGYKRVNFGGGTPEVMLIWLFYVQLAVLYDGTGVLYLHWKLLE